MIVDESIQLITILKQIMKEIDGKLDLYGYNFEEKTDVIYEFLMTTERHYLDEFFQENLLLDPEKILTYKGMVILLLCTDFYINIAYRVNNKKICVDYQNEIFSELDSQHTYKKIVFFFKNPYNTHYAKAIINHFYFYLYKDEPYINKCINNILETNRVFKLSIMNPLFNLEYYIAGEGNVIEPEVIKSEIIDLYDDLNLAQTQKELDDDLEEEAQNNYLIIVCPTGERISDSLFVDLYDDEELEPLFIELKEKMLNLFRLKYPDQEKFNCVISYIISSAYESMKIDNNDEKEDYSNVIGYIENNGNDLEQVVDLFIKDDGFSNCILYQFVSNNKIVKKEEIVSRRKQIEEKGFTKVLKKYNRFYDIEGSKYGGSKDGKAF